MKSDYAMRDAAVVACAFLLSNQEASDPDDDAAVDRFLTEANRIHPVPMAKDRKVAKAS
jgi:hypothetical protein